MSKLNVLYEDNHVIVVEKPVNVLSQADSTKDIDMLTLVKEYIKEKYHKPGNVYLGLVHRLDRPVGGIMVFARTSKAASRLSEQVRTNKIEKVYLAIVKGILKEKEGTFKDKIKKIENGNSIIAEDGKEAILNYQVLSEKEGLSLVKVKLITGRHHQIRVQFSSRGYPLCGDQRYGDEDKTQIALYAYELSFYHPTTKEKLTFTLLPKGNWWTEFTLSKYV
ncbi:MAG: RluA family pseudouridine synthase [Bacilli bacterium]|nr:RluA family pseudouridine synthase [Bacilli bacterium]